MDQYLLIQVLIDTNEITQSIFQCVLICIYSMTHVFTRFSFNLFCLNDSYSYQYKFQSVLIGYIMYLNLSVSVSPNCNDSCINQYECLFSWIKLAHLFTIWQPICMKFKVLVLRPVQQPGSYWDRSTVLPLVGVRPTQRATNVY